MARFRNTVKAYFTLLARAVTLSPCPTILSVYGFRKPATATVWDQQSHQTSIPYQTMESWKSCLFVKMKGKARAHKCSHELFICFGADLFKIRCNRFISSINSDIMPNFLCCMPLVLVCPKCLFCCAELATNIAFKAFINFHFFLAN